MIRGSGTAMIVVVYNNDSGSGTAMISGSVQQWLVVVYSND
jgi:hypothetical protein